MLPMQPTPHHNKITHKQVKSKSGTLVAQESFALWGLLIYSLDRVYLETLNGLALVASQQTAVKLL